MAGQYIKEWRDSVRYLIQAWADLEKGHADGKAAISLFRLNHAAKEGWAKESTYLMKNQAIKIFYKKGYCIRATKEIQNLPCWHTVAYVSGEIDRCPKCFNTGVYRSQDLYHFTMLIDGTIYSWHQPAKRVDWPVVFSGEPVIYDARAARDFTENHRREDQARLYVYLRLNGAKHLPAGSKLSDALRYEWLDIRREISLGYYRKVKKIWEWAEKRDGRFADLVRRLTGDPIPF